ncbi:MAG: hypothetical protein ABIG95_04490 [Candidatus Woesearchaeota archaeon]
MRSSGKTSKSENLCAVSLVTYSLENLNHSHKTLFGYALKGRKGETGFVDTLSGEAVGRNNVLVPSANIPKLEEFLATWKVAYSVRNFLELRE